MQPNKARTDLWMDLILVAFLIGFDVAARLLPHAPGVWPFAASALFAGCTLRRPAVDCGSVRRKLAGTAHALIGAAGALADITLQPFPI